LIANPTLWGNASKLVAVVGGTVISYAFMRFWTFAGGSHDRPRIKAFLIKQGYSNVRLSCAASQARQTDD
jgi:putative flippase GtrA